ncbi:MAG: hypothetical protein KBT29_06840 [Prevotellaceae bacterium]|nr:hypothetical protein [Candidatus Minthosoma caballi]
MKKILLACSLLMATAAVSAQSLKGTSLNDRLANNPDSADILGSLSLYQDAFKRKSYVEAIEPWEFVFEKAPLSMVRVYKDGAWMFEKLFSDETDPEKKQEYYEKLMKVYDQRLKYMDKLNEFSTKKDQSSKGGITCRKAYDSYFFNPNPDVSKSYDLFKEGINDTGNDTEGFVLYGFIQLSDARYKYNNDKYREDYINDYMLVTDICGRLLQQANEYETSIQVSEDGDTTIVLAPEAERIIQDYQPPFDQAEALFVASGAADCDALDKIYRPKVEANKTDNNYLQAVLKILSNFECDKSDLYDIAADYSYQINKTPQAAIGKASKCLKANDTNGAIKYFDEAIALTSDNASKGKYAYIVAALLYKKGNTSGCLNYINKTLQYTPSNGSAYLLKASIVARSGSHKDIMATAPYCLAIDICNRAKSADPSCAGRANKAIANYTANLYPKSEGFMAGIKPGTPASTAYGSTTIRFR